jgi:hypothetical protein
MTRRVAWHLLALATAFLTTGVAEAAVQGRDTVCWLGTGGWQLTEKEGEACLVESRWDRTDRLPRDRRYAWYVSAPTIKGQSGKYLGGDPEGRRPSVRLLADKGATTRWVFEIVSTLQPGRSKEEPKLDEGPSGFTFRVKMAEGRFKGWYLAAEDEGRAPRRLKLVRDVKEATVFTYIEENLYVDHK